MDGIQGQARAFVEQAINQRTRPIIAVSAGILDRLATDCESALISANASVFSAAPASLGRCRGRWQRPMNAPQRRRACGR